MSGTHQEVANLIWTNATSTTVDIYTGDLSAVSDDRTINVYSCYATANHHP